MTDKNINIVNLSRDPDSNIINNKRTLNSRVKGKLKYEQKLFCLEDQQQDSRINEFQSQEHKPLPIKKNKRAKEVKKVEQKNIEKQLKEIDSYEQNYKANIHCIQAKMRQIHERLEQNILNQQQNSSLGQFKIFTSITTTKKDIDRIEKEKLFVRSQDSRRCRYQEPKMQSPVKTFKRLRLYSEMHNEKDLTKKAYEFTKRVQKEKEKLWGQHLLRKKLEEKKRQLQTRREQQKIQKIRNIRMLEKYKSLEDKHLFANSRVLERKQHQRVHSKQQKESRIGIDDQPLQRYRTESVGMSLQMPSIRKPRSTTLGKIMVEQYGRSEQNDSVQENRSFRRLSNLMRKEEFEMRQKDRQSGQDLDSIQVGISPINNSRHFKSLTVSKKKQRKRQTQAECQSSSQIPNFLRSTQEGINQSQYDAQN